MNKAFSRRTVLILAGLFTLSLMVGLALTIFQEELSVVRSSGSDSFSYSAIGHRGFKTLVEELGFQTFTSRNNSGEKTGDSGLLVLAEPNLATQIQHRKGELRLMCDQANSILIVLPKRGGVPDPYRPGHLESVYNLPPENSDLILGALGIDESLIKAGHSRDLHWTEGSWSDRPFIDDLQLLYTEKLIPIIASPEGVLLGEFISDIDAENNNWFYGTVYILTDPDMLANHGLNQGNNAAIAARILDFTGSSGGAVVFDETLHGHEVSPSMFRSFFRVPMVFILLQVLLTAGVFMWLATGRFGSPLAAKKAQGLGLDYLINNTAELLDFGGHGPFVLGRYYQAGINSICRRLHLELPGSSIEARKRLLNISTNRSPDWEFEKMAVDIPAAALDNSIKPQETLKFARAIHRWQQEMTNG